MKPDAIEKLNQTVVDIEYLLISVVQGLAVASLGAAAVPILGNFQFEYWLYVVAAFLLILNFWSQAIIHTISFIDWPINMWHNFLYFFVSFIEVMAFSQIGVPAKWFEFMIAFFVSAFVLYAWDLRMIEQRKQKFQTKMRKQLFAQMYKRQRFEMFYLLPAGLLFNILAVLVIRMYPDIFIDRQWHVVLAAAQVLFSAGVLFVSIRSFQSRTKLLEACANE